MLQLPPFLAVGQQKANEKLAFWYELVIDSLCLELFIDYLNEFLWSEIFNEKFKFINFCRKLPWSVHLKLFICGSERLVSAVVIVVSSRCRENTTGI